MPIVYTANKNSMKITSMLAFPLNSRLDGYNRYHTWAIKILAIHSIWACKLSQHKCLENKVYIINTCKRQSLFHTVGSDINSKKYF